jgi:DNA repair protein NreA
MKKEFCNKESSRTVLKRLLQESYSRKKNVVDKISGNSFFGPSPPGLFVSWTNYPKVNVSSLSAPCSFEKIALSDSEEKWFGLPAETIFDFREQLVRSSKPFNVSAAEFPSKDLFTFQEIALAEKSFDIEVKLKSRPFFSSNFSSVLSPMGPQASAEKIVLAENTSVNPKLEYLASDTDVKTSVAIKELFDAGVLISSIQKVFSAGLLGEQKKRKIVPTKWSITAVDDSVSLQLIEKIKHYPQIGSFQLFESSYLDNHFFVLLIPDVWGFEVLEAWTQENTVVIGSDSEGLNGRKKYASSVGGAYYSARVSVTRYLENKKKQARAMIFREIGSGYSVPLGCWVIRETVQDALEKRPLVYFQLNDALSVIEKKLSFFESMKQKSVFLNSFGLQKKLSDWCF